MSQSLTDQLKSQWKNTKVGKVEDGTYIAKINSVELKPTKKDGTPMFAWDIVLPDNSHFWHNRVLKDDNGMKWAKSDFAALGFSEETMDDMDALIESLSTLAGCTIEVEIKSKGEFQNCFIKQMIERFNDEEIPF